MEYVLIGLVLTVVAVVAFRRKSPFVAPAVTPISDQGLAAFEAAPSLWVNAPERLLFAALHASMPNGYSVHGKVRLEDIIRVRRTVEAQARWSLRGRVKSRHVDYLVIDNAGRPVLAIELDGASHDPKNPSEADRVKSALFAAVGIPLRRIRVGDDFGRIAAAIAANLRPY